MEKQHDVPPGTMPEIDDLKLEPEMSVTKDVDLGQMLGMDVTPQQERKVLLKLDLMLVWGGVLMCHAAAKNFGGLMAARFFLGVGEAAIAPGFALITGMYYKREEQPARQAAWFFGNCVSTVIGGVVAYGIGTIKVNAIESWQLLFLFLGAITAAISIFLVILLPDAPQKAIFLTKTERTIAVQRTLKNKTGVMEGGEFKWNQAWLAVRDPQTWFLVLYTFSVNLCNGGVTSFSSIIINGFGFTQLKSLLMQMPLGGAQIVFLLITAGVATAIPNTRILMMIFNTTVSLVGMILVWKLDEDNQKGRLTGLALGAVFAVNIPLSLSIISSNVAGFTKRSTTSALMFVAYCVGNIVGPQFFLSSEEPHYPTGMKAAISGLALGAFFLICLYVYYIFENKRRDAAYGPPSELTEEEERMQGLSNKTDLEIESFQQFVESDKMSVQAAWEACSKTDTLFILVCSVFCWLIIPAVGLAYSGYSTRYNSLASFYPGLLAVAVCSIQWWMLGYSLAYGEGNSVFGGFSKIFHIGVLAEPVGSIPEILFSEFQLIFCATVCAIAIGGACERGRLLPLIPFIFLWCTFIYAPLAHMVWSENGFLANLGALDFAGGTPVHICSGATATAMSLYLSYPLFRSKRSPIRTPQHLILHKPHNTLCQLLALIIIWNAWLAFDAGTTLALNFKSVMAACVTNLCAASGALTWASLTYYETGKWSLDSTFLGAIAGLVLITPSAGFIDMTTAVGFGVLGASLGRQALRIKFTKRAALLRWVDNGDTFATHCLGGFLGTIVTGLFARREVAAYDGSTIIKGGVVFDGNWGQLWIQIVEAVIGFVWSFGGSYVLYALVDCVPGFEVLGTDEDVIAGMDASQMGESLYAAQWEGEEDYHPFEGVRL
ncbi:hypothetical protein AFCA_006286 [Aspergillus flavus]|nr:hypothetical protein AFCA_006286 [Aspergillus flavus]